MEKHQPGVRCNDLLCLACMRERYLAKAEAIEDATKRHVAIERINRGYKESQDSSQQPTPA